jgi:membrane-bound metal-dependent hydrolase YbcI (DUF457 family)
VDIVTHGLASLAVVRGFFPRAGKAAMGCAVLAGTIANIDWLSQYIGASAFFSWHHTYTHSLPTAFLIAAIIFAIFFTFNSWKMPKSETVSEGSRSVRDLLSRNLLVAGFVAPLCTALLHIAMDACQSVGVTLFWPFSHRQFAADWLPRIDPWILTILIACIAVPELLHLVSSEIGAKAKKPRGQTGAIIGLALVLVYAGVRATLHSNAVAMMESRTFHGETPRRASAFPDTLSLITWHGAVETVSAINQIEVDATSASNLDTDSSLRLFKPEPSPTLDAARNTAAARRFLGTARIPKASVEKTESGYVVVLRDLRYEASGQTQHEIAALIELDLNNKVTSQELVWASDLRR